MEDKKFEVDNPDKFNAEVKSIYPKVDYPKVDYHKGLNPSGLVPSALNPSALIATPVPSAPSELEVMRVKEFKSETLHLKDLLKHYK